MFCLLKYLNTYFLISPLPSPFPPSITSYCIIQLYNWSTNLLLPHISLPHIFHYLKFSPKRDVLCNASMWGGIWPAAVHVSLKLVRSDEFTLQQKLDYRIAGNFQERKHSRIGEKYDFHGENFHGLLACAAPKNATPQISRRKLLRIATKP